MTSIALLIARLGLGIIFVAHGWQKLNDMGLAAVTTGFRGMGVPVPELAAYFATFVELVGGVALIAGAFTGLASLLLVADMLGALFIVHIDKGVFVSEGGFELVLALGVGCLVLAVFGAGRYSVDGAIGRKLGWVGGLNPI